MRGFTVFYLAESNNIIPNFQAKLLCCNLFNATEVKFLTQQNGREVKGKKDISLMKIRCPI